MNKSTRVALLLGLVLLLPTSLGTMARPMEPASALPSELPLAAADVEPLGDISDAELVYRLARIAGHDVTWPALPAAPSVSELPALVMRLGERAGAPVAVEDARAFLELDPAVAAPVAHLLVAVEMAWDLRDQAFVELDAEEQVELWHLVQDERVNEPRYMELHDQIDPVPLIEGAILLLDTLEGVVLPQLLALKDVPVWPEQAIADPVGVLRIGGTGNDVETKHRIVQIDARGDDWYGNNAGATTILNNLGGDPNPLQTPVGISVDFQGADRYERPILRLPAQGGAFLGMGVLLDAMGADAYTCERLCQGGDGNGVALLRDRGGNDKYAGDTKRLGAANLLSVLREDAGSDSYYASTDAGGYSHVASGLGLLWDRAGQDEYLVNGPYADLRYGWGENGGRGWLVDEGEDSDYYESEDNPYPQDRHGCNGCTWTMGSGIAGRPTHGHGVDDHGGLGYLISTYEQI